MIVVVLGDKLIALHAHSAGGGALMNRHHHEKLRAEVRVRPNRRGRLLTRYGDR